MLKVFLYCAAVVLAMSSSCQAGMLIGPGSGNDHEEDVREVIEAYNSTYDPDLQTDFDLFKKSEDDSSFVFDDANGFLFFSDPLGQNSVESQGELDNLVTAYFSYTGPASLLYYSVKSSDLTGFKVYEFSAGLNELNVATQAISHVSFWIGQRLPQQGPELPEPASAVLLLLGVASAAGGRRLMRPKNDVIES